MVPFLEAYDPSMHLSIGDVSNDSRYSQATVIVKIKASKTDSFRSGNDILLGQMGEDLCPLVALLGYINVCGLAPSPLFTYSLSHS